MQQAAASNETGDSIHKTGALRRTQKPDKVEMAEKEGERERGARSRPARGMQQTLSALHDFA